MTRGEQPKANIEAVENLQREVENLKRRVERLEPYGEIAQEAEGQRDKPERLLGTVDHFMGSGY